MITDSNWNTATIGGTLLRDWVATGTLELDRPGVQPFPCSVGSPSGAFVDATSTES